MWSAWWLREIRAAEEVAPATGRGNALRDITEGWRVCRGHPIVFPLLMAQATFGLFAGFFSAIYMLFALRTLGLSEAAVGLIIGVGGVSALAGAFVAAPLSRTLGYGRAIVLCLGGWILASVFVPAAEGQGALAAPFLALQQLVGDGFLSAYFVLTVSVRQTAIELDVQARTGATFQAVEGVTLPIGALIAGPLAEIVGPGAVLWIAIAGALVPLLILSFSKLWTMKMLEDSRVAA